MPLTIVLDTNYIRQMGPSDFLDGRLPPRLKKQVETVRQRGDLILLPRTVAYEVNAWLNREAVKRHTNLLNAKVALEKAGLTVSPDLPSAPPDVDILNLMKSSAGAACDLLEPELLDYEGAEYRTSFRLPPHPKNVEHEEMRDRLIWCQMLRYSEISGNRILIVSNDRLFKNGETTEEGVAAGVSVVTSIEDLDQRLGDRPPHIEAAIANLLVFAPELKARGITLTYENIEGIEQLRNVRTNQGVVEQTFELHLQGHDTPMRCTMSSFGGLPFLLSLNAGRVVVRSSNANVEMTEMIRNSIIEQPDAAFAELRAMMEDENGRFV